ncbi:MAG: class IV adenylate cyclase [Candidatus Micrarchaeales archaeon]|jgi:adenylate cyclase class 2
MIEIETKIDGIDVKEVKKALKRLGANAAKSKLFRRYVFNLEEKAGEDRFIRLRSDGKKSTLTYKHRQGTSLANTEEVETEVKDFDATARILSAILPEPLYQENKRTSYNLDGVEISIDEWPKLPPILEIEADSEEKIKETIDKLGIKGRVLGNISWEKVYSLYGMDLRKFKILKFE